MSIQRRTLGLIVTLSIAASACSSNVPSTSTPAETTTSSTTPEEPEALGLNADLPDFSTGYQLDQPDSERVIWAIPDSTTTGCEGEPGWRIWSASKAGDDAFLATPTIFAAGPGMNFFDDGVVLHSSCEEQSWQLIYANSEPDGALVNERPIVATGAENLPIQKPYFDQARNHVVFTLADGDQVRLVAVDPSNGQVADDFILGDPASGCSAQDLNPTLPDDPELTAEARATRDAIVAAAVACDFAELERIGGSTLGYSLDGGQSGAAHYWALAEYFGQDYLEPLVDILSLRSTPTAGGDFGSAFGWPAETGSFYGYRTSIGVDGAWLWFMAGD